MKPWPEGKLKLLCGIKQEICVEEEKEGKRQRDQSQKSETDKQNSEATGHKRHKGDDEESEVEYIDEHGKKRRAKRRSKNDLDGRDYK